MAEESESPVSISEAARRLGISRKRIQQHLEEQPELRHGTPRRPQVVPSEIAAFRTAQGYGSPDVTDRESLAEARRRREVAKATREEVALAEQLGELVPRGAAEQVVDDAARFLRETLQSRWRRIAPRLVGKTAPEISRTLEEEGRNVLRELRELMEGSS